MTRAGYSSLLNRLVLILIFLTGFQWRISFIRNHHPYWDEFVSMLASVGVQKLGLPILPSGMLYTHGFLFSVLNGIYVGFLRFTGGNFLPAEFQVPYRLPGLFLGMLTLALIYRMGKEWFSSLAGLISAAFVAIFPQAVLWGTNVRMYSLTLFMVPLLVYVTYKTISADNGYRWQIVMFFTAVAALASHFILVLLLPPLALGIVIFAFEKKSLGQHVWFWNLKTLMMWITVAGAIVFGAALLQSRSLPPSSANFTTTGAVESNLSITTVVSLISNQMDFAGDWQKTTEFLQSIVWHQSLNITFFIVIFAGALMLLLTWFIPKLQKFINSEQRRTLLFLFVVALGPLAEITLFVPPFRQTSRYFDSFWPLVILLFGSIIGLLIMALPKLKWFTLFFYKRDWVLSVIAVVIILLFTPSAYAQVNKLHIFRYNQAFLFIKDHWQPGDIIITPYTPASLFYLGQVDYFATDVAGKVALLNVGGNEPVDRYLGVPWVGEPQQLQKLLQNNSRVWFLVEKDHFKYYYRGQWKFVVQQDMKLVKEDDAALVYLSNPAGIPLPTQPDHTLNVNLGNVVQLQGYSSTVTDAAYRIYLFWKPLQPIAYDLTQFVHIRFQDGKNVSQADVQPVKGQYPTSNWQTGETVIDVVEIPVTSKLPPGEYEVLAGLYRWDTLERLPVTNDTTGENAIWIETLHVR